MSEEEIEVVAEELAKSGGISWYPGREGPILRTVSERFRDRAKVAIAAIDRFRTTGGAIGPVRINPTDIQAVPAEEPDNAPPQAGDIVVYRRPGEQRAIACRVVSVEDGEAYLTPLPRPDIGWVSLETLKSERLRAVS